MLKVTESGNIVQAVWKSRKILKHAKAFGLQVEFFIPS